MHTWKGLDLTLDVSLLPSVPWFPHLCLRVLVLSPRVWGADEIVSGTQVCYTVGIPPVRIVQLITLRLLAGRLMSGIHLWTGHNRFSLCRSFLKGRMSSTSKDEAG